MTFGLDDCVNDDGPHNWMIVCINDDGPHIMWFGSSVSHLMTNLS